MLSSVFHPLFGRILVLQRRKIWGENFRCHLSMRQDMEDMLTKLTKKAYLFRPRGNRNKWGNPEVIKLSGKGDLLPTLTDKSQYLEEHWLDTIQERLTKKNRNVQILRSKYSHKQGTSFSRPRDELRSSARLLYSTLVLDSPFEGGKKKKKFLVFLCLLSRWLARHAQTNVIIGWYSAATAHYRVHQANDPRVGSVVGYSVRFLI